MHPIICTIKVLVFIGFITLPACKGEKEEVRPCSAYTLPVATDQYDFPVRPGTPAWASLKTGQEKRDICQVPDTVLKRISTVGLVETCLDYPLLSTMSAHTSLQRGTVAVLANFNGFNELRRRPESGSVLANRYRQMGPQCLPSDASEIEQGAYSFTFTHIEMILAQDDYLTKLSAKDRKTLLREALTKYQQKNAAADIYGIFGLKTTAFLLARIMQVERYKPFLQAISSDSYLQVFTDHVELQSRHETLDIVLKHATRFKESEKG